MLDDLLFITKEQDKHKILNFLNSWRTGFRFIPSIIDEKWVTFLEMDIMIDKTRKIITRMSRKPYKLIII